VLVVIWFCKNYMYSGGHGISYINAISLAKVVKWSLVIVTSLLTFEMPVNLYLSPFWYDVTDSTFWNTQYFQNTPIRVTILEKSYYFNFIKVRYWRHSDNFDRLENKLQNSIQNISHNDNKALVTYEYYIVFL
jgi:hypothetical protein